MGTYNISIISMTFIAVVFLLKSCAADQEPVVFSVVPSNTLSGMTTPTRVVFDHVLVNSKNGYDATTGIFTAPVAGYYSFSASLISWYDSRLYIILNGKSVEFMASLGRWQGDSATVNLKLVAGDRVWINAVGVIYGISCGPNVVEPGYICPHASFSGFLIARALPGQQKGRL